MVMIMKLMKKTTPCSVVYHHYHLVDIMNYLIKHAPENMWK